MVVNNGSLVIIKVDTPDGISHSLDLKGQLGIITEMQVEQDGQLIYKNVKQKTNCL